MSHLTEWAASCMGSAHHHEMAGFRAITLQDDAYSPVNRQRTAGTADTKSAQQFHETFP